MAFGRTGKLTAAVFAAGMLLTSCGNDVPLGEPVHLYETITENEIYLLNYRVCDGERTISYRVPSGNRSEAHAEIFEKLQEVEARPLLTSEKPELTCPIYSVFAQDEGASGENVEFAWSDGYLYDSDGTVYAFDFDFGSLAEDYGMTYREEYDVDEGVVMNCRYYIAQNENGWIRERLVPDTTEAVSTEEVLVEGAVKNGDHYEITLENVGGRDLRYWIVETLDVKLDGAWYNVPRLPGNVLSDCPVDFAAGTAEVYTCVYDREYGALPAGEYRIRIPLTYEGVFETENLCVYHEFVIG